MTIFAELRAVCQLLAEETRRLAARLAAALRPMPRWLCTGSWRRQDTFVQGWQRAFAFGPGHQPTFNILHCIEGRPPAPIRHKIPCAAIRRKRFQPRAPRCVPYRECAPVAELMLDDFLASPTASREWPEDRRLLRRVRCTSRSASRRRRHRIMLA